MMPTAVGGSRALAVDLRRRDTGAVLGVALLVPSRRHVSFLTDPAGVPASHDLSADAWREIDDWTVRADAGLPAEPAPLNPMVLAPLVVEDARSFPSVRRFASLPIPQVSGDDLIRLAKSLLPALLTSRSAA